MRGSHIHRQLQVIDCSFHLSAGCSHRLFRCLTETYLVLSWFFSLNNSISHSLAHCWCMSHSVQLTMCVWLPLRHSVSSVEGWIQREVRCKLLRFLWVALPVRSRLCISMQSTVCSLASRCVGIARLIGSSVLMSETGRFAQQKRIGALFLLVSLFF